MFLFETPNKRRTFLIFSYLLVLAQPIFSFSNYTWNLVSGAYPSDADSIMILICSEFIAWLIWMPIFLFKFLKWTLADYTGSIPLRLGTVNEVYGVCFGLYFLDY